MIDPIKMDEAAERFQKAREALKTAENAAVALKWLVERAGGGRQPGDVLTVAAILVAGGTPGAGNAQTYVTLAAEQFAGEILERAGLLAMDDLKDGKAVLAVEAQR